MSATLSLTELMDQRISANAFDSSKNLSKEAIQSLLDVARKAPSAFNAQNWKVLAVVSPEAKQVSHAKAFGQQKVLDAAVIFLTLKQDLYKKPLQAYCRGKSEA